MRPLVNARESLVVLTAERISLFGQVLRILREIAQTITRSFTFVTIMVDRLRIGKLSWTWTRIISAKITNPQQCLGQQRSCSVAIGSCMSSRGNRWFCVTYISTHRRFGWTVRQSDLAPLDYWTSRKILWKKFLVNGRCWSDLPNSAFPEIHTSIPTNSPIASATIKLGQL